jgi:hypothetical protein
MLAGLDSWQDCGSGFNGSRQNAIDDHSNAALIEVAATPSDNSHINPCCRTVVLSQQARPYLQP